MDDVISELPLTLLTMMALEIAQIVTAQAGYKEQTLDCLWSYQEFWSAPHKGHQGSHCLIAVLYLSQLIAISIKFLITKVILFNKFRGKFYPWVPKIYKFVKTIVFHFNEI